MCANLICVQIWLQIAPDQWPRRGRGHSSRSPAALELHSLERDKVLTSCITILMSKQILPRGPKWVKREVSTFRGLWHTLSWNQLPRDVPLESHETLCILTKQGFGVVVMVPNLNCVVRELLPDVLLDKVCQERLLVTAECAFWSARATHLSSPNTLTSGSLFWGGITDKATATSSDTWELLSIRGSNFETISFPWANLSRRFYLQLSSCSRVSV